ncbi:MAG TPA: hypothetical protein VNE17_07650 [Nitrolancea sp.]|nr:hypothetical protein [Nitrolancea sp.]
MSAIATSASGVSRPGAVTAAVVITVISQIASLPLMLMPESDSSTATYVIGGVTSLLLLFGAWNLWHLRRWVAILTFVVTLLTAVPSLLAFVGPTNGWVLAAVLIGTPLSIAALVLIALPVSRRSYR